VATALLALEREFGIPVEISTEQAAGISASVLQQARDRRRSVSWEVATLTSVLETMGFRDRDFDGDDDALLDHDPNTLRVGPNDSLGASLNCQEPPMAILGHWPRRWRGDRDPRRVLHQATSSLCGGGDPPPPCTGCCSGCCSGCCDSCCSDPCCGNPCCNDPCCGDACCIDPCCGSSDPCCGDLDCDGIPNGEDPDMDGDGIPNGEDGDVDGDGLPNASDPDIDGDGIPNASDPDMDGDGHLNGDDDDADGDGFPNFEDPSPEGCTGSCCGSFDPCCGGPDPCCGDPDPCCGVDDPCCGSTDPCCGSDDPCCDPSGGVGSAASWGGVASACTNACPDCSDREAHCQCIFSCRWAHCATGLIDCMADFGITIAQGEAICIGGCIPLWLYGDVGYKLCLAGCTFANTMVNGLIAARSCNNELLFCTQSAEQARDRCIGN